MAFLNRIRLPFKLTRPQFAEERGSFRKANGETKTQFVVIKKTYEGETDWMPEKTHERLKIALAHDTVNIEGDKYLGGVVQEGDYEIQWQDFLDYPTAKAKFKAVVTPFSASNTNCQTCDEATQLELQDDVFEDGYGDPLALAEDTEYTLNVADNDSINCNPATFSVTSFNSTYLDSATIDQNGVLTIHTKTPLQDITNVLLVTYRVTCPNGGYDEANVYGNIDGSIEADCLPPENLVISSITTTTAIATWEEPATAPSNGYIWELYEASNPGLAVQTGTEAGLSVNLSGLDPDVDYIFYVKSDCGGSQSDFVDEPFTTSETPVGHACGRYRLESNGFELSQYREITYMNCLGEYITQRIYSQSTIFICAAQDDPGVMVYYHVSGVMSGGEPVPDPPEETITVYYLGLC